MLFTSKDGIVAEKDMSISLAEKLLKWLFQIPYDSTLFISAVIILPVGYTEPVQQPEAW